MDFQKSIWTLLCCKQFATNHWLFLWWAVSFPTRFTRQFTGPDLPEFFAMNNITRTTWPAQLPDLNIVEIIWLFCKQRLSFSSSSTGSIHQLFAMFQYLFMSFLQKNLEKWNRVFQKNAWSSKNERLHYQVPPRPDSLIKELKNSMRFGVFKCSFVVVFLITEKKVATSRSVANSRTVYSLYKFYIISEYNLCIIYI